MTGTHSSLRRPFMNFALALAHAADAASLAFLSSLVFFPNFSTLAMSDLTMDVLPCAHDFHGFWDDGCLCAFCGRLLLC